MDTGSKWAHCSVFLNWLGRIVSTEQKMAPLISEAQRIWGHNYTHHYPIVSIIPGTCSYSPGDLPLSQFTFFLSHKWRRVKIQYVFLDFHVLLHCGIVLKFAFIFGQSLSLAKHIIPSQMFLHIQSLTSFSVHYFKIDGTFLKFFFSLLVTFFF